MVLAARVAESLERITGLPPDEADDRLRSRPGIGMWTSAEVRRPRAGDADAVSFGDYHVAKDVGWALTGEPMDDHSSSSTSSRGDLTADGSKPWSR